MGKTYKDGKDYRPVKKAARRRNSGFTKRGCNLHGVKNCGWCMDNLTFGDRRNKEFWDLQDKTTWVKEEEEFDFDD